MPISRGRDWGNMTFGSWLPCVKANKVLEYLVLWVCLGACSQGSIIIVDLILTFDNLTRLIRVVRCANISNLDRYFVQLFKGFMWRTALDRACCFLKSCEGSINSFKCCLETLSLFSYSYNPKVPKSLNSSQCILLLQPFNYELSSSSHITGWSFLCISGLFSACGCLNFVWKSVKLHSLVRVAPVTVVSIVVVVVSTVHE